MECQSCLGTGKVYKEYGRDKDNYPTYCTVPCPMCGGSGTIDDGELFVVPRALIKDEFFASTWVSAGEQKRLRKILEEEQLFLQKIKGDRA